MNLIQNSLDALKDKPFPNGEKPTIWIEGRETNEASCLIVRDNGPASPANTLTRYSIRSTPLKTSARHGARLEHLLPDHAGMWGKFQCGRAGKFCEFTLELPKQP